MEGHRVHEETVTDKPTDLERRYMGLLMAAIPESELSKWAAGQIKPEALYALAVDAISALRIDNRELKTALDLEKERHEETKILARVSTEHVARLITELNAKEQAGTRH